MVILTMEEMAVRERSVKWDIRAPMQPTVGTVPTATTATAMTEPQGEMVDRELLEELETMEQLDPEVTRDHPEYQADQESPEHLDVLDGRIVEGREKQEQTGTMELQELRELLATVTIQDEMV